MKIAIMSQIFRQLDLKLAVFNYLKKKFSQFFVIHFVYPSIHTRLTTHYNRVVLPMEKEVIKTTEVGIFISYVDTRDFEIVNVPRKFSFVSNRSSIRFTIRIFMRKHFTIYWSN